VTGARFQVRATVALARATVKLARATVALARATVALARATVALARSAVAERLLVLETVHAGLLLVSKKELPFSLSSGNAEAG
jgi:hypothetical protein